MIEHRTTCYEFETAGYCEVKQTLMRISVANYDEPDDYSVISTELYIGPNYYGETEARRLAARHPKIVAHILERGR